MYENIEKLIETVKILRSEQGCKWDREQTHATLRPHMLEEAYEAVDAINSSDMKHLKEELGDVLLQVVLHSQIASEHGDFSIDSVACGINEKLIRRHPHVFGSVSRQPEGRVSGPQGVSMPAVGSEATGLLVGELASHTRDGIGEADCRASGETEQILEQNLTGGKNEISVDDILKNWENIKSEEKPHRKSALDGVSKSQPALMSAFEISKKAVKVGFEWQNLQQLYDCILSEFDEFAKAETQEEREEEFGDILFALVNLARWKGIDPEQALILANKKFTKRFQNMEQNAEKPLKELTFEEWEELWAKAKTAVSQD